MCMAKKPKVAQVSTKEPGILRNPYLDGIDPLIRARQGGVKSLTISRDGSPPPPIAPPIPTAPPISGGTGRPGQGNLSDKDFATATMLSQFGGPLGLYGKSILLKAQK